MEENNARKLGFYKGFLWGLTVMLALGTVVFLLLRYTDVENLFAKRKGNGTARQTVSERETGEKLKQLADIIDYYYYEDPEAEQVAEGVYKGLLESLGDAYSQYYTAEEYSSLQETTTGSYCGIGAVLSQNKETNQVTLLHAYPGAPAQEAGLKDGDVILTIDGEQADSQELADLVKRIKGQEGSRVRVTVSREGVEGSLEFDVERRQIQVPTVEYQMLDGEVGYLKITEFSDLTADQFQLAIAELEYQGMASLIVDVRDNPGGVLSAASDILDQILPEGVVVYTEDKYGQRKDYVSSGETYMDIPMAVLINENSASAAEIFAGAVKDYEYGTLIGTKTFGKGIVQSIIPLEDGSAVKVTTARYFTPSGSFIHQVGIEPDIALEYEYLNEEDAEYDPMHDNQVQKALEVLQSQ